MMSSYAAPDSLIAMGVVLSTLGLVAVLLRFGMRKQQKIPLLTDDWLIIPAEILLIVMVVALIIGVEGHAVGYKLFPFEGMSLDTIPEQEVLTDKVEFAITLTQPIQIAFAKLSILFFYRRIFCIGKQGLVNDKPSLMSYATIIIIILVILWSIATFFVNLFACGTHFSTNWAPLATVLETAACVPIVETQEAFAISDFLMDFVMFVMPLPCVWKLNMPTRRKLGVMTLLALGALAIIASVLRLIVVLSLVEGVMAGFFTPDPDIIVSVYLYWSVLESGLVTVIACLPTLRSLVLKTPDFLRRLGSIFSLGSRSPRTSRSRSNFRTIDNSPISSRTNVTENSMLGLSVDTETYAMRDIEAGVPHKLDGITILGEVAQDSSHDVERGFK